ncbi:MAG: hypothetical protein VCF24_18405 [Candidatus Latescibacterota bacterium]
MLYGERTAVVVRAGCNGVEALFLILAGVLAVPATWAVRGRALVCYLPLLFALNLLRVVGLLYVLARFPEQMSLMTRSPRGSWSSPSCCCGCGISDA